MFNNVKSMSMVSIANYQSAISGPQKSVDIPTARQAMITAKKILNDGLWVSDGWSGESVTVGGVLAISLSLSLC